MREPLLEVEALLKDYVLPGPSAKIRIRAVNGVSFSMYPGEVLGLVGESGSGKSTVARCIVRRVKPTAGSIRLRGVDVVTARGDQLRQARREIQMVFQDPYSSLDPRMRVEDIIAEGILVHRLAGSRDQRSRRVLELLELVGLQPYHRRLSPRSFSGGQRQRIGIARARAVEPRLLVCDEPVSSLDVSIQAQIINLFIDLRERLGLAILFIAHDLAIVRHHCDRVAVMQAGRLVEIGSRDEIYGMPQHPYTKALISATSVPDPEPSEPPEL